MAISFVSAGTFGITPGIPAGTAANDILVLVTMGDVTGQLAGWTVKTNVTHLHVQWKRATGSDTTNAIGWPARIYAFRGCTTSGDPFNVAGSTGAGSFVNATAAAITPNVDNAMVLFVLGAMNVDSGTGAALTIGNPSAGPALSAGGSSTVTNGGGTDVEGCGLWYGLKTPAGTTATETTNLTVSTGDTSRDVVAQLLALAPVSVASARPQVMCIT